MSLESQGQDKEKRGLVTQRNRFCLPSAFGRDHAGDACDFPASATSRVRNRTSPGHPEPHRPAVRCSSCTRLIVKTA